MLRSPPTGRLAALALLAVTGCVGIYFAARSGGASAAVFAAIALVCALALLARTETSGDAGWELGSVFDAILIALPGALVVFLSFNSGGYFPDTAAIVAVVLVIVLVLRLTLVEDAFTAISRPLALATVALGAFTLWILASSIWSDAPGSALTEYDRAFMYLLVLVVGGSVVRTAERLRWLAGSIAAAALIVAIAALATRLAPDHFHTSIPAIGESNLAYPLTYSNALGILCALGAILALYFATSVYQGRIVRVAGAAALPVFATTVYLTLSRGPVAAGLVGIVAFLVLARPRGTLSALVAAVPPSVIAVAVAYHHPVLTSNNPQSAQAASDGHDVALVLIACVVGAALVRLLLTTVDERIAAFHLPSERRRPVMAAAWGGSVLALVIVALAVHAPSRISDQYDRFVSSGQASPEQRDVRQSVFSTANRGIVDNWQAALDAFRDEPLHGQGAGTYENYWNEHRPANQSSYNVVDAHSLYLEVLGELGIVGLALLVAVILSFLVALLPVGRGGNRSLYAALFSVVLAWAVHAGVDWDWETPAVTLPAFAIGGAALAAHASRVRPSAAPQSSRVSLGVFLLVGALAPALVFTSQRQLNDARDAARTGNCTLALERAADSIGTLGMRSEPYETMALCQQQKGRLGLAIAAMRKAVANDPDNWRYHYQLGVLLGGASQNTRPDLLAAQRLNPHNPDVTALLKEAPEGQAVNWDLELLGPSGATVGQR